MNKAVTILTTLAVAAFATTALAQPYYAKGDMYCAPGCWNWDAGNELNDAGLNGDAVAADGIYSGFVTTDQAAGRHEFKIADQDWTVSWPGSNAWCHLTADNAVVFFSLDTNVHGDGWIPDQNIVWSDSYVPVVGSETWGVIGDYNGWSASTNGTPSGSIWSVTINHPAAGTYQYKWRANDNWDDQVMGGDGGASAGGNLEYTTTVPNQDVLFELDAATGRVHQTVIEATSTEESTWGEMKQLFR